MSRTQSSVVIDRAIEDVWDFLSDFDNLASWYPEIQTITPLFDRPFGLGSTIALTGRIGPFPASHRQRVTEFEPGRALELRSLSGPLEGGRSVRIDLEPAGAATRLIETWEERGLVGLLAAFGGPSRAQQRDARIAQLKGLLEQRLRPAAAEEPVVSDTDREPIAPDTDEAAAIVAAGVAEATPTPNGDVMDVPVTHPPVSGSALGGAVADRLVLRLDSPRGHAPAFEVPRTGATLGRAQENTIRLDDLSVSRRHARIAYRHGAYWISDLKSTSGTWIDGTKLNAPRRVAEGQLIDIGILRLRAAFVAEDDEAPTDSAAAPAAETATQGRRRR
ncbi:hypothetical protein BH18CHL2_BH18CHL2_01010 [soil metagenome]